MASPDLDEEEHRAFMAKLDQWKIGLVAEVERQLVESSLLMTQRPDAALVIAWTTAAEVAHRLLARVKADPEAARLYAAAQSRLEG